MPHKQRPTRPRYGDRWYDEKAPDGFTINGWRQVHKGGYVRIVGARHYHAKLAEWVGQWVFVEIDDGFAINANVWPDDPWKDSRTMLRCTNESDWFADNPKAAVAASRRHGRGGGVANSDCPTCGKDGGTSCGMPNCGRLQ